LTAEEHERVAREIEHLATDEARLFAIEVRATEVPADRATAWLTEAGLSTADPLQRFWPLLGDVAATRLEERLKDVPDAGSLFATTAKLAARHTQLVTTRLIRARSLVEEFRIVRREGGAPRTIPVNGTAEEGLVVSVRPVASVGGLASLDVSAILARIEKVETWTPADAPGDAPTVSLPRHRLERAAGQGTFGQRDTIVLAVPVPGSEGARVVLIRVRHLKP
jgi:hypothetical protein